MNHPLPLELSNLLAAAALVTTGIALSRSWRYGLLRSLTWAATRTVVQLLLVGYILVWIFDVNTLWAVLLAFAVMLSAAIWTASGKASINIPGTLKATSISLAAGSALTAFAVCAFVVRVEPHWWEPRYFLPLSGMIIGNAMNAVSLAIERLHAEISNRRNEIEELLCLGATPRQAVDVALRSAMKSALLPTVNMMLTVGVVALPGMMNGQIIAGAEPTIAARYQIVVMFMIATATTISATMIGSLLYGKFFTDRWQLRQEFLQNT